MEKQTIKTVEYPVEAPSPLLPFLLERVRGKSRNAVKSLLLNRQVWVDGKAVSRHDFALTPGMRVTLLPPGDARAHKPPFPILYQDDALIAIDKPAGLLTVANEREKERTAYRKLSDFLGDQGSQKSLFVVHRLDMDTSGVVIFARTDKMKYALQDDWNALVKCRAYLAIVEGAPPQPSGTVRSWLLETANHTVYSGGEKSGGKEAVTRYQALAHKGGYTLLRVELDSGRKNQIRVHMKDLGCPILGDKKYGNGDWKVLGRLGLHACELAFTDPRNGQALDLIAPPPREFLQRFPTLYKTLK